MDIHQRDGIGCISRDYDIRPDLRRMRQHGREITKRVVTKLKDIVVRAGRLKTGDDIVAEA